MVVHTSVHGYWNSVEKTLNLATEWLGSLKSEGVSEDICNIGSLGKLKNIGAFNQIH